MSDRIARLWQTLLGGAEYSEPAMAVRAALFMLPTALIVLAWDPTQWWRVLILWVFSTFMAYKYGLWVRDDED